MSVRTASPTSCSAQRTSPYELVLAASFRPEEMLPAKLAAQADCARWLFSTILRKTICRDTDAWGCARLSATILRRVMGHEYSRIVQAMEDDGAIDTCGYRVGVKSTGYRIGKRFLGDRPERRWITDRYLIDRLRKEEERLAGRNEQTEWKPIHRELDALQQHLTLDSSADGILSGLPRDTLLSQRVLVANIRDDRRSFSVSSTGRVFNCFSGVKRELRKAARLAGREIGCVDVSCCQPALLALLIRQLCPPVGLKGAATYKHSRCAPAVPSPVPLCLPPLPTWTVSGLAAESDFVRFASVAGDGTLYEVLQQASGLNRAEVKELLMQEVLAKRGGYQNHLEDIFQAEFPSVYRIIKAINRKDHAELIRLLQRVESWLVIENVAPRLVAKGHTIVTIHDSIYAAREVLGEVEEEFRAVINEMGVRMSLKRE